MNREDIIRDLSRDTGLRYYECDRMLDSLVDIIWDGLKRGEEVRISRLGVFHIRYTENKKRYNLNKRQVEYVPPENYISFRFSEKERAKATRALNESIRRGDINFWQ